MSTYPGAYDEFRNTANIQGVVYNPDDETTVFAEDTNAHSTAIIAIEQTLGTNPAGDFETVADRLDNFSGGGVPVLEGYDFAYINNYAGELDKAYFTKAAEGYRLMWRDGDGRSEVQNPVAALEIANKQYVDALWPVGAIFTTTAGDDETQPALPGVWVCIATGALIGDKITYSWERTE